MEKYNIRFQTMDQIVDFVKWGETIEDNMDLSSGVMNIDAKSMMGIIVIGLNRDLVLSVQGELTENEKDFLKDYIKA
jgi:phosphotransferase system HPr-like phosphotransfer protein